MNRTATMVVMTVLLALATSAAAQPDLRAVDGDWQEGSTVTLRGADFGNKQRAAPLLWDTLDNQAAYDGVTHGQVVPTGEGMPWRGNGSPYSQMVTYSTQGERAQGRPHYSVRTKGYLRGYNYGEPDQLFLSWWFRSTIATDEWGRASTKFNRIIANEQTSAVEHNDSYCVWWGLGMAVVLGPTSTENVWNATRLQPNTWHHMEMMCDSRALTGSMTDRTGRVRAWRDGTAVHDTTYPGRNPIAQVAELGFDPSVTDYFQDDTIDFGEVYIDTTQARVVAANAPVYSSASHTELQLPVSWNDSSIETTANVGSFGPTEPVWLFVIDRDGKPSPTGILVRGEPGDLGPPGMPGQPFLVN